MRFYELPHTVHNEIDTLERLIERHIAGEVDAAELKAHRVPFGVYEQRKDGSYMVRVRCTAGGITPEQLAVVARCAEQYGSGVIHATTRQELQIHDVSLESAIPALRELAKVGLSSRGGGGNTVRNITASYDSGVAADEVFDVTPWAVALSSRLIADPESWKLPRKFKITFANREPDNANARFNDLGFVARMANGQQGFAVYAAGGMGAKPEIAHLLHEFIPSRDILAVTRALRNLFSFRGNRRNKHAARLRFLFRTLGEENFVKLYKEELGRVMAYPDIAIDIKNGDASTEGPVQSAIFDEPVDKKYQLWKSGYVYGQKQRDRSCVIVPLFLGQTDARCMGRLAAVLKPVDADTIRLTMDQNIALRNIPPHMLPVLYRELREITDLAATNPVWGRVVSCAGAQTCRLGICNPRELVKAIYRKAEKNAGGASFPDDIFPAFSGCPNSCGQHPLADIGFFGGARRNGDHLYPSYKVVIGAIRGGENARFADPVGDIPAYKVPEFLERVAKAWKKYGKPFGSFTKYIETRGKYDIHALCLRYKNAPSFEEDKNIYYDWGADEPFSLKGKSPGECSAGVFDLIDLDISSAKKHVAEAEQAAKNAPAGKQVHAAIVAASRALLITKGVSADSPGQALRAFQTHFIDTGLISPKMNPVIDAAVKGDDAVLVAAKEEAMDLIDEVEALYNSMDDSLVFPAEKLAVGTQLPDAPQKNGQDNRDVSAGKIKDYRGVACPMNFVKVKIDLAGMSSGDILEVLLDDGPPIENVPRSVLAEGHAIVRQERKGECWSLVIRKQ
ncbi:MAG: sulfite reductase subunit beta (hemoprotein) [Chitinivibrionales bacterium]|nr:sulfite reductase subunit beta (hemoprotein) [Chitinivibrionales bacterium]